MAIEILNEFIFLLNFSEFLRKCAFVTIQDAASSVRESVAEPAAATGEEQPTK